MSATERVDLLSHTALTLSGSVRTTAVATLSMTPSGQALTDYAACNSHEARKNLDPSGVIDLLGDSPLPHAASSVTTIAVGSPIDLLGDEIIEPPAVTGSTPNQLSPVDLVADSKHGATPGSAAASSQKPGGRNHDLPRGSRSSAVGSEQQPLKDTVLGLANDNGVQNQQPQQCLPSETRKSATNTGKMDQRQEQQELVGDSQVSEAHKAKITQDEQRSASTALTPSIVTFKATQPEERPSSCSADGSLEGKITDRASGGGSQSLPSDADRDRQSGDGVPSGEASEAPSSQASDGDERIVDSDREVVEEEDAFGDFADFTSASHFLPGGAGVLGAVAFSGLQTQPPPSASVAAARAASVGPSNISSPSSHRHAHLGGLGRQVHCMLGSASGVPGHHATAAGAASVSGAVSEHGSLAGEFSDVSHQSPPPSVAPSRGGGGRKSVASIASVGSRAGGDDDLGDYNSVVGSSVWRAPSQMATSSYAAAAGADDDFGDFTSDITSTSDFAPSTQPPSAVAVSGPGSVHPDDDFGSFASHRSTADDDEDDFGNFNAAPAAMGPAAAAAGPSGSGGAAAGGAAAGPAGSVTAAGGGGPMPGAAAATFSPRDAAAAAAGSYPYHSTQSVGPLPGGSVAAPETGAMNEMGLLQFPPAELLQAVARALQPLLPAGTPGANVPQIPDDQVVSAAWAQLRRHVQGNLGDAGGANVATYNGVPFSSLGTIALSSEADGMPDSGTGRNGGVAAVKFTRPLRWKGSDSERRLLAGLGLSEVATQARMAEAVEGLRQTGRGRLESAILPGGGARQMGTLASFGDVPRRARADVSTISGSSDPSGSRSRGLEQNGETHGSPSEHGGAPAPGTTPRASGSANGFGEGQQPHGVPAEK
ncbi:hypothetical protein Vretimale_15121 [Volvox reticuliferus]|uniref:Uncharacterized protein n=1 Tax=Volvox reticuliferus TaxID=1737510 RepID=A0A8J4GR41_9CHLO|nr:hypothetical protein Vretifemale_5345 [Volvox reticuliferus]GIM11693.1 hypothetical protein Vretimale_15121 [Volvox reticuliferus]